MFRTRAWLAVVMLPLMQSAVAADWLFTPMAAYHFGGDTVDRNHAGYGFALGLIDEEAIGFEADVSFSPHFFDGRREDFVGTGSVLTAMGNVLFTGPLERRIMPYVAGGAGYMGMRVTSDNGTFTTTTSEAGFNAGGGVFAFLTTAVGLRGDIRYVRSFRNQRPSWTRNVEADIAPGAFDYWRAALGVTIRIPS